MARLGRLGYGEKVSAVSAVLLFVSMFFNWFGVEAHNTSNLLFAIQSVQPDKSAWEALDYIPIALLATVVITLAVTSLRLTGTVANPSLPANAAVVVLGVVSTLLILYRIIDPPVFGVEPTITSEGVARWAIFFALAAAAGVACGGLLAARGERSHRRARLAADA